MLKYFSVIANQEFEKEWGKLNDDSTFGKCSESTISVFSILRTKVWNILIGDSERMNMASEYPSNH
jgi:hypothetical protein